MCAALGNMIKVGLEILTPVWGKMSIAGTKTA
jgi:hypothetical protein